MKLLEEELNIGGFRHRQIWRDGDVAVYEKHARGKESPCYETILIQSHDGAWIRGKYYPPAETYPSSSRWGELGWTFTNRDRALSKAEELRDVRSRNARKRPPAVLTHPEHQTRR